jgi:SOS-response cell division inhibitor, blocks FtsZ ring formation
MANPVEKNAHPVSRATQPQPPEKKSSGLTEIVLPVSGSDFIGNFEMVLPMLAHLSHQTQNRWLTWITTTEISKADLSTYGFQLQNVQVVRVNQKDVSWVLWEALSNGTSSTVVANVEHLSKLDFDNFDSACRQGNCRGLIFRSRH